MNKDSAIVLARLEAAIQAKHDTINSTLVEIALVKHMMAHGKKENYQGESLIVRLLELFIDIQRKHEELDRLNASLAQILCLN